MSCQDGGYDTLSGMATVVYIWARSLVGSRQDWNRSDVGSKPAHCFGKSANVTSREAPARAIPSHVACHMSHSHSSKTRRPARRKGPLSVWSDPGAGQASFFCQRGPHWSERPFGIGTGQGQRRHQISFILPAPREGPAGTGTRCGVRVQGAGVRGVRSLRARVAGGGRHGWRGEATWRAAYQKKDVYK